MEETSEYRNPNVRYYLAFPAYETHCWTDAVFVTIIGVVCGITWQCSLHPADLGVCVCVYSSVNYTLAFHPLYNWRKSKITAARANVKRCAPRFVDKLLRGGKENAVGIQGVPGECARLRENVPYVKVHRYNPKHPRISEVELLRR